MDKTVQNMRVIHLVDIGIEREKRDKQGSLNLVPDDSFAFSWFTYWGSIDVGGGSPFDKRKTFENQKDA